MPYASDIITFIGIPLAVLGVLPILYTAINSLITIRKVAVTLHRNGLSEASTRGSLMSGVVEVSLPRFSITPLDREEDAEYWELNPKPSNLKGGTWTIFNWNCLITGSRLYRLQYSDDLQIPQAEIEFEELLAFLLDRGAVPDVKGLHMLHVSGLWTPTGTSLMLSPDTTHSALRVSVPNDSDGVLSLALQWDMAWDNRDPNLLPPGWMRLQLPQGPNEAAERQPLEKGQDDSSSVEEIFVNAKNEKAPPHLRAMSIRFRLAQIGSSVAISNATWEHENLPLAASPSLDHLCSALASNWAPTIALALGLSRSVPLYNHNLDSSLSSLATRDTIPCGVLVVLGLQAESEAPPWETKYDPNEHHLRLLNQSLARQREEAAERLMNPQQARAAKMLRTRTELHDFGEQTRKDREQIRERQIKRQREAVGSSRLDTQTVTMAAVNYLKAEKLLDEDDGVQSVVEALLIGMVRNEADAMAVCTVLERWRQWSDRGGMNLEDLEFLEKNKEIFCNAACVMGVLRDVGTKKESAVAMDMRACVQHWNKIRLG